MTDHTPSDPTAPTRRRFVMTGLAAGFALAVQPITADTIKTASDGLEAGEVSIPVDGGKRAMPAYRAMPAGKKGPFPVVLVVHEIWGVHEYIQDVCRRLARLGYLAVAPELYFRDGGTGHLDTTDDIFKVVNVTSDAQVMADLGTTAAWAADKSKGDPAKVAVTGFCWGGRIVWLYAAHNKDHKCGVAWYGHIVGGKDKNHPIDKLHPKYPIDVVTDLKCPVLGMFGEKDDSIPVATAKLMEAALQKEKKAGEIKVYEGTLHGFHADYRKSYHQANAADGWKRMLDWFKTHGVA